MVGLKLHSSYLDVYSCDWIDSFADTSKLEEYNVQTGQSCTKNNFTDQGNSTFYFCAIQSERQNFDGQ